MAAEQNIDAERAAFEAWARDTNQGYASLKGTSTPSGWRYFEVDAKAAWAAWQAGRRTPSASIGEDAWHAAVLAECMRVESCYKADDPAGTLRELINWHTTDASAVAETIKIHADEYLRLTCGSIGEDGLPEPSWGAVHTVGEMVRNLLTLDQSQPIYSAFHVDFDGQRRCRTRPVCISRERVIDGKWVDMTRKDVPYATVVWAKQDERMPGEESPQAAQGVKTWQERLSPSVTIDEKPAGAIEQAMCAEIAELRAQLARQSQGEPIAYMTRDRRMIIFADNMYEASWSSADDMLPLYAAPTLSSEQQAEKGEGACGS
jgi:hypothetical protein